MKVVTAEEMARIERLAYEDGAADEAFMEQAGRGIAQVLVRNTEHWGSAPQVTLVCGKGNNGGDGYVAGRYLLEAGFRVQAIQLAPIETCSPLLRRNAQRFSSLGGRFEEVQVGDLLDFPDEGLILDGIFGTGFRGEVEGVYAQAIRAINESGLPSIAIDIPSGLNGSTGEAKGEVVLAQQTLFLGLPKVGFFIMDGWNSLGELVHVDFGLGKQYIDQAEEVLNLILPEDVCRLRPKIVRTRHKYQAGYVVGLAGSPGMSGAAILSAQAAMRGGAGIVKLLHPGGMEAELANSPVELIKHAYSTRDLDWLRETMEGAGACYAGPGLQKSPGTKVVVNTIVPQLHMPCVIDADAINIMAEEGLKPPRQTVLTPHGGEMCRLLGLEATPSTDLDFLARCSAFAKGNDITLVLKGGPSFVMDGDEPPHVLPRGNPGMATAGSGDVLTGLITALLAQGLSMKDGAIAGGYLHGVAGEYAAEELTPYCMVASDIIDHFPDAFHELFGTSTQTAPFSKQSSATTAVPGACIQPLLRF